MTADVQNSPREETFSTRKQREDILLLRSFREQMDHHDPRFVAGALHVEIVRVNERQKVLTVVVAAYGALLTALILIGLFGS